MLILGFILCTFCNNILLGTVTICYVNVWYSTKCNYILLRHYSNNTSVSNTQRRYQVQGTYTYAQRHLR